MDDYKLPEADAEVTEELDITEHTGVEKIKKKTMAGPWMVTRECINTCSWPTWCRKNNVAAYDGLCTGYWKFNFW